MTALPWFITIGVTGLAIGLLLGILIGSALVRSHYTHQFLPPHAQPHNGTQPQPVPRRGNYRLPEDYY